MPGESHIYSTWGGVYSTKESHTSAVLGEGVQCQESHTSAVPGEGVQCQENHIYSARGGCAVPRESYLQYQGSVYSTRSVTFPVPIEGVES